MCGMYISGVWAWIVLTGRHALIVRPCTFSRECTNAGNEARLIEPDRPTRVTP